MLGPVIIEFDTLDDLNGGPTLEQLNVRSSALDRGSKYAVFSLIGELRRTIVRRSFIGVCARELAL